MRRILLLIALLLCAGYSEEQQLPPSLLMDMLYLSGQNAAAPDYLGPAEIVTSPNGSILYVAQKGPQRMDKVNAQTGKIISSTTLPDEPTGLALAQDGKTLYITCASEKRPMGVVAIVHTETNKVSGVIDASHFPRAPILSKDEKNLYISNQFLNRVAVIDLSTKKITQTIPVIREPYSAALTPDGNKLIVTNYIPFGKSNTDSVHSKVTVINTNTNTVETHIALTTGSQSVAGVEVSPDGKYAYVTHVLSRFSIPTTRVDAGWINSNALAIIDLQTNSMINTILLDDFSKGAGNPWYVKKDSDGNLYVTIAGGHELITVDATKLHAGLKGAKDLSHNLTFTLDKSTRHAFDKVRGPRALAVNGKKVFVAGYFSDNIASFDFSKTGNKLTGVFALSTNTKKSPERLGEERFFDASICFQNWQSCTSCHPGARTDGLNWDLPNDGLGNPKNGKNLMFLHQTAPMLSSGIVKDVEDQIRGALKGDFFLEPKEEDAVAISAYLKTLAPVPSPHLKNGSLSPAAVRGKAIFNGKAACVNCHAAPLYTDLKLYDVGTNDSLDHRQKWDTPSLVEAWRSAPYMHNGGYNTIREAISVDKHKPAVPLTEQELSDLIEFVKSL